MKPENCQCHELKEKSFEESPQTDMEKLKNFAKSKTVFCKHEGGCLSNCIFGAFKSFYLGYLTRLLINLLALLVFQKQGRKKLIFYIMAFFNKSNFKLGGFLGCYSLVSKGVLCILRRIRGNDSGLNAFLSGTIAGYFSLLTQPKSSWYLWRVYLWGRAFDMIYQNLLRKKIIKNHFWNWGLIMGIFNTLIGYAFLQEPECLPRDVVKLYFKFSHLHENDLIWRAGAMEWKKRLLQAKGVI